MFKLLHYDVVKYLTCRFFTTFIKCL